MHQNALLQVEGLSKTFTIHHLDRTIPAFQELHFALHPGEFLLITGPNGAGKSTLLRCLYRTYLPTGGHAWFASHYGAVDLAQAADIDIALLRQAEIGFVTQFLKTRPRVTAQELVAEPLLATSVSFSTAQQRAQEALAFFGVKPALWNAYPTTFSGGEQQKVNLARALIRPYRLLLLDEPTASLDIHARQALVERLAALKREGVAMMAVLHHAEDAATLVDRQLAIAAQEGIEYVVE
ncbi:MAG: phosphonate C-P lyase system protein PhnL [Caldilineaceae bacterium]